MIGAARGTHHERELRLLPDESDRRDIVCLAWSETEAELWAATGANGRRIRVVNLGILKQRVQRYDFWCSTIQLRVAGARGWLIESHIARELVPIAAAHEHAARPAAHDR